MAPTRLRSPALMLVLSSCLALLLLEAGARVLIPPPRTHRHADLQLDPSFGFRGIPSARRQWTSPLSASTHEVVLNEDGFRGRLIPDAPPAESREGVDRPLRVALLGDSFGVAEAVPVEEILSSRLDEFAVSGGIPRGLETYNLSTIDYGTGQQWLIFEAFADRIRPDVVVLLLFPTNDVANNAIEIAGRTTMSPGDAVRPYVTANERGRPSVAWVHSVRGPLRALSRVFSVLEAHLAPPSVSPTDAPTRAERLGSGRPPRAFLEVFESPSASPRWKSAWAKTEELVVALRDSAHAKGARFVAAVVPSIQQVRQTAQTVGFEIQTSSAGYRLESMVDWNLPERRLAAFFREQEIEAEFFLNSFRDAVAAGERLFTRDSHLTAAGHARIARRLTKRLSLSTEIAARTIDVEEPAGVPVSLSDLRAQSGSDWLDLRRSSWSAHFSDGWVVWRPRGASHPGGWQLGQRGVVGVPMAEGPLVVRGIAGEPLTLYVGFIGRGARGRYSIERPGGFEIELPRRPRPAQTANGHAAVFFDAEPAVGQVIVQEVGFATAEPAR